VSSAATSGTEQAIAPLTAAAIAELVGGRLEGSGDTEVRRVAALDRAEAGDLSFLASRQYALQYARTRAGVVLLSTELAGLKAQPGPAARVVVDEPHAALLRLLPHLYREAARPVGIHETARIGRGARIGEALAIGAYAVIGEDVVIGDRTWIGEHCVIGSGAVLGSDVRLHAGSTVYGPARLGDRVIIQTGARIGSDGFGYTFEGGEHRRIPHVGRCIVEDDVEVGANSTIDRGSVDDTVIGAGTKIDNLVQIGHNVRIGRLCLLMSQVGVAGSTRIGDGVVLAGQAGLAGHISIGDGARIAAQSGVFGDVPAGETWSGYPARPHREALRASAATFKLAGMMRRLERLLTERE